MSPAALALGLVLSGLQLDVSFATGFGSRVSLGGVVQLTSSTPLWETPGAAGSLGLGVWAGYQLEPYAFSQAYLPGTQLTGATHRLEGLLLAGHDLQLFASRRLLVGVHLFAGWMHVVLRGGLVHPSVGVSGTSEADAGALTSGVVLRLGVRLTERVHLTARGLVPFPYATAVAPYVLLTLGVTVAL